MQSRIEHLNIRISLDVAGCDFTGTRLGNCQGLRLVAMQFERNLLKIENDVRGIFYDTLNRRKLMLDAFNLYGRNSCTFNRR